MHPLLKYITDEIRSWNYETPASLMAKVAGLLREVIDNGGVPKQSESWQRLRADLTDFKAGNPREVSETLHRWDLIDTEEVDDVQDDAMTKFKRGVVWVVARSLMLFFNPDDEKLKTFEEWQEFVCRNIEKVPGIFLRQ